MQKGWNGIQQAGRPLEQESVGIGSLGAFEGHTNLQSGWKFDKGKFHAIQSQLLKKVPDMVSLLLLARQT